MTLDLALSGSHLAASVALIATAFLLAGLVKGVIGLGLPTVAMALLGLVMTPLEAAALLVVPSLVTNLWQLAQGPRLGALARRLATMLAGICLGTWLGMAGLAALGPGHGPGQASGPLGIALMVYALLGLSAWQPRVPARFEPWLSPLMGLLTGMSTAATGIFALPAVPFLQALALDRDDLVQALGLAFTVSTVALAAGLFGQGALRPGVGGLSLFCLAPALAGMALGQRLRHRLSPWVFRRCFFVGLLGLGAHLAWRG